MANITKTTAANFIPQIWATEALSVLRSNTVMGRLITRDSEIEGAEQVGDTLNINYPGTFAVNDKAAGSAVTLQTPTGASQVQLVLNKHKEVSFLLEDVAKVEANLDLMNTYLQAAIVPIVEQIETDIFALYASFTHTAGTSGTDLTAATVRTLRKNLIDQKVPSSMSKALVLSTKDSTALLGDSNLQSYFAFSQTQGVKEGSIGRLYGFDLYESQLVPVVAGTPNSTKNLAFAPQAIIAAFRTLPFAPAGQGVEQAAVADEQSGFSLRVTMAYNPTYLGTQVTIDVLYGLKVLRDQFAVVALS